MVSELMHYLCESKLKHNRCLVFGGILENIAMVSYPNADFY